MKNTAIAVTSAVFLWLAASVDPVGRTGSVGARSSGWSPGAGSERKRSYPAKRRQFIARHRYCEIRWDSGCTGLATDIHHRVRRGLPTDEQKLDESLWQATCRHCHQQKERYLEEAHERGLSVHHWEL